MKKIVLLLFTFFSLGNIIAQVVRKNLGAQVKQKINIEMRKKAEQYNLGETKIPNDTVHNSTAAGGRYVEFERGWVYYNPKLKLAFAIWGEIQKKWAQQNYEFGFLGFPTTDYTNTPIRTGAYQHFDNGSIYYTKTTGAHFMKGWFKDYWAKLGWENAKELGFPTTDELSCNKDGYTIYQQFEYGTLFSGLNKAVVYSKNKKATEPTTEEIAIANPQPAPVYKKNRPKANNFEMIFRPGLYTSGDNVGPATDEIDLYGFMDVRVFKSDGIEINDKNGKSYTLFNIEEKNNLPYEGKTNAQHFGPENINFQRRYNITKADIDGGAYVRIFYWLHDYDNASGNEHLVLVANNGKISYAGVGQVAFREIKIIDMKRAIEERKKKYTSEELGLGEYENYFEGRDIVQDGSDALTITYSFELKN
jgi:hypothetical protein